MPSAASFMSVNIPLVSKQGVHIPRINWTARWKVLLPVILSSSKRNLLKQSQAIFGYSTCLLKNAIIASGVLIIISLSCRSGLCLAQGCRWRDVVSIPFIGTNSNFSTTQETNVLTHYTAYNVNEFCLDSVWSKRLVATTSKWSVKLVSFTLLCICWGGELSWHM